MHGIWILRGLINHLVFLYSTAIDAAYKNPNATALAVPRKGEVPTLEGFIVHIASKVRDIDASVAPF